MLGHKPRVIPVELYPADWCLWCDDPDHSELESCHILSLKQNAMGEVKVEACGCKTSLTFGKKGDYILRVTKVQKE